MRYFPAMLIIILAYMLPACSSTEAVQQYTEPEPEEEDAPVVPDWYDSLVFSSSDSLSFYGFSMASSADSSEAAKLSAETALQNLRFEIDLHAENVRLLLSENSSDGQYASPSFIIQLRNAVRELDLEHSDLNHEYEQSVEGIHYVYTRAAFARDQLKNFFETHISDPSFLEQIQNRE